MTEQDRREHEEGRARQQHDQASEHAAHVRSDLAENHYLLIRYIAICATIILALAIAESLGFTIGDIFS